jgi:hypothetical protein
LGGATKARAGLGWGRGERKREGGERERERERECVQGREGREGKRDVDVLEAGPAPLKPPPMSLPKKKPPPLYAPLPAREKRKCHQLS